MVALRSILNATMLLNATYSSWRPDFAINVKLAGTNKCLDLKGGSTDNGTPIEIWDCVGNTNQKWSLAKAGGGAGKIVYAANTGKCIDNLGGGGPGNKLGLWDCNGQSSQAWGTTANTHQPGTIYLVDSEADASLCMDLPGGDTTNGNLIQVWNCYGGGTQMWSANQA